MKPAQVVKSLSVIETSITVSDTSSPVDLLSNETGLAKARIKDAMTKGAVWLKRSGKEKRVRRARFQLSAGDVISLYYDPDILASSPPSPELTSDKKDYSIWYKPAGLLSSGSRFGDHHAIDRWIEKNLDRPSFLVHRLDRFTSGLMVIAHKKSTAANLSQQFQQRATRKVYQAIVVGELTESKTIRIDLDGKRATSHVAPIESNERFTLVNVDIETGRKHQIRRHLAEIGYPVVGDRQYGRAHEFALQLVATEIGFTCPNTSESLLFCLEAKQQLSLNLMAKLSL